MVMKVCNPSLNGGLTLDGLGRTGLNQSAMCLTRSHYKLKQYRNTRRAIFGREWWYARNAQWRRIYADLLATPVPPPRLARHTSTTRSFVPGVSTIDDLAQSITACCKLLRHIV